VHVMLHDDLVRDGAGVIRGYLEFLSVDASLAAPPPTDAADARAAVEAMGASVAASADDYVALLDAQPDGDRACEDALRLAREITALLQANSSATSTSGCWMRR